MTRIIVDGKILEFDGPIEVEMPVCPICSSPEVMQLSILVPDTVLLPEMKEGYLCLNCDAVFPGKDDLNFTPVIFDEC
jgi:hypothetical protein